MVETLTALLQNIPTPLATILLGAVPLSEISGALPVGVLVWKLPWYIAFICAVIGNALPIIPLFFGLELLREALFKVWPRLGKMVDVWIDRAHKKMHGHYEQYGFWALFVFTAVPFPLTGVYTAATAAVALKIPFKETFFSLLLGVIASGILVLVTTVAGDALIEQL